MRLFQILLKFDYIDFAYQQHALVYKKVFVSRKNENVLIKKNRICYTGMIL